LRHSLVIDCWGIRSNNCLPSRQTQYHRQCSLSPTKPDRNYTAMRTHMWWSVHLSALLITWFTWGDRLQRRYTSDITFCIVRFPLTVDNSDMN
jgi:hypothetical protein